MSMLEQILTTAQIIASIVVVITLVFTAKTYLRMRNTEQVKISHEIFIKYSELEKESARLLEEGRIREQRMDWASRYFNMLEWFSLLVNSNEITNDRLIGFYVDLIYKSYEKILPKYFSQTQIKDEYIYPEFQTLYKNLKKGRIEYTQSERPKD